MNRVDYKLDLFSNRFSRPAGIIIMVFLLLFYIERTGFGSEIPTTRVDIALIRPTFTAAAYSDNGFYDFYDKHSLHSRDGRNITEDVSKLTVEIPIKHSHIHPELFEMLPVHIEQILQYANIRLIDDTDAHNGEIFKPTNDSILTNAYDILMIGHQEYVTQQEYSNLKTFVSNGGTLIVLTGNVFYAEVRYDASDNSVTLVKGHDWNFNGKTAWRDIGERWKDETRKWLGSNYYPVYYHDRSYHQLRNNPFDFIGNSGGEEQYYDITNPRIQIILDYGSSDPRYPIATYKLDYGKGKVIVIGLPSEDIISDPCSRSCQKFINFFDYLLLNHALNH
jgi:hypothetical protein